MEICIIKLGAAGDVLRTIPLAMALKRKYPFSNITWVTREDIKELLDTLPFLKRVVTSSFTHSEEYDLLYNFDLDDDATSLAASIKSKNKKGFYKSEGFVAAYNLGAEYYINTVFDDDLKRSNRKTYQEMMFEAAELSLSKEVYTLVLKPESILYAREYAFKHDLIDKKIIGIHMGSSPRWPSKAWSSERIELFIRKVKEKGFEVILFGGPNEQISHPALVSRLAEKNISIFRNDPYNTKQQFAALMSLCTSVVCGDSLALHVAVGLGKQTIALFFCTSPYEVESYGLVKKIVSPLFASFFPDKSDQYSLELTNSIDEDDVLAQIG